MRTMKEKLQQDSRCLMSAAISSLSDSLSDLRRPDGGVAIDLGDAIALLEQSMALWMDSLPTDGDKERFLATFKRQHDATLETERGSE